MLRCQRCQNPMYDPQEPELRAECAWCGHIEYSEPRGYYHGLGARA